MACLYFCVRTVQKYVLEGRSLYMKWFVPFNGSKGQSNAVSRAVPLPRSRGKFLGAKFVAKMFQRQTIIRGSGYGRGRWVLRY